MRQTKQIEPIVKDFILEKYRILRSNLQTADKIADYDESLHTLLGTWLATDNSLISYEKNLTSFSHWTMNGIVLLSGAASAGFGYLFYSYVAQYPNIINTELSGYPTPTSAEKAKVWSNFAAFGSSAICFGTFLIMRAFSQFHKGFGPLLMVPLLSCFPTIKTRIANSTQYQYLNSIFSEQRLLARQPYSTFFNPPFFYYLIPDSDSNGLLIYES